MCRIGWTLNAMLLRQTAAGSAMSPFLVHPVGQVVVLLISPPCSGQKVFARRGDLPFLVEPDAAPPAQGVVSVPDRRRHILALDFARLVASLPSSPPVISAPATPRRPALGRLSSGKANRLPSCARRVTRRGPARITAALLANPAGVALAGTACDVRRE